MGKTVTLKGEAARAYVEGMRRGRNALREAPLTDTDKRLFLATRVTMYMKTGTKGDARIAIDILEELETKGLEAAYQAWCARG